MRSGGPTGRQYGRPEHQDEARGGHRPQKRWIDYIIAVVVKNWVRSDQDREAQKIRGEQQMDKS